MIGTEVQDAKRKVIAILKVLQDSKEPLGARIIAQRLKSYGIELGERAVRYHLKITDERGLTRLVGRDGRLITPAGEEELKSALVRDKVGFAISRIELLAFRTNFDPNRRAGLVPVNVSFFPEERFAEALKIMKPVFEKGLCVSDLVITARAGEKIGDGIVPKGKTALGTICSVVINGTLLKAGVPMDSRFGGIMEIKNHKPVRFVELINYAGSSMDPSEVFIRARMTSVLEVARKGEGKLLANYREIPALCRPIVENVVAQMKEVGIGGLLTMGNASEPVCEIPVELNRIGVVLLGGLNPVAAAEEAGIETDSHAMSTLVSYQSLTNIKKLVP
jgi:HTH-type transcriptional regulator, global nitrogen regulator NrpRI